MTELRNIFISHIHEDDHRLDPLIDLASNHSMKIRDGSINSSKPNNAESENHIKYGIIKPRIVWASVLVVLISPGTKNSWWVNWEIECAARLNRRIVGVWDHGAAGCDIPDALNKYADAVVGWNGARIVDAINGNINNWELPDGSSGYTRIIPRFSC